MKRILVQITVAAVALALIFGSLFGVVYLVNEYSLPRVFSEYVQEYSFRYGVDANLVYAVIKAESNFDENAVSAKGARGLMQLMPITHTFIAHRLGVTDYDIDDPETNIRFGTWYLGYLYEKFQSRYLCVAAYNAGEGNLRNWLVKYGTADGELSWIPFPETRAYTRNVMRYYDLYRSDYQY